MSFPTLPPTSSAGTSIRRSTRPPSTARPVGLAVLLSLLFTLVSACGGDEESATGPEEPTFSYVIPAGSGEQIENGEPLAILPRELLTEVGETIQIVNEDDRAHFLGPWFVGPGETLRQRFVTEGVFEGTCSVHPSGEFTVVVAANESA